MVTNNRPFTPVPKPEPTPKKSKGGLSPRKKGDRAELAIAKDFGERRTPGSGAFKNTNKNLEGDIDIRDNEGVPFIKLEIKYTGQVDTTGAKSYNLTTKVLDQMEKEAVEAHELGALIIHYKGGKKYAVIPYEHFKSLVELAKMGRSMQK